LIWILGRCFDLKYLAKVGEIDTDELLQSFNMGVGMILVVPPASVNPWKRFEKTAREIFPHRTHRAL